jgi:hypothetical protein
MAERYAVVVPLDLSFVGNFPRSNSSLFLIVTCDQPQQRKMSDPRFARLRTDPRFRHPKVKQTRVVVDERFKAVFEQRKKKNGLFSLAYASART